MSAFIVRDVIISADLAFKRTEVERKGLKRERITNIFAGFLLRALSVFRHNRNKLSFQLDFPRTQLAGSLFKRRTTGKLDS